MSSSLFTCFYTFSASRGWILNATLLACIIMQDKFVIRVIDVSNDIFIYKHFRHYSW
jgi:hypothetical protein